MEVITEEVLRGEIGSSEPLAYVLEEGKMLSPAARDYLNEKKIEIITADKKTKADERIKPVATGVPPMPEPDIPASAKPKFVDYASGAFYMEKPEYMTHLYGNVLVPKSHQRILFRGKLDSLQSLVVLVQCELKEAPGTEKMVADFQDILESLREMMRCDVMDEPFQVNSIIGLSHAELRQQSHNPAKFFDIPPMVLPDYSLGKDYALLNRVRTAIRETETAAAEAFIEGTKFLRKDIIQHLNRLSSAVYIMMCKYLAGQYK